MRWSKWLKLLRTVSSIRDVMPYGFLKEGACDIESAIEAHMAKIEPRPEAGKETP